MNIDSLLEQYSEQRLRAWSDAVQHFGDRDRAQFPGGPDGVQETLHRLRQDQLRAFVHLSTSATVAPSTSDNQRISHSPVSPRRASRKFVAYIRREVYFSGLFAFLTPRPKSEDDYLFLGVLAWLGGLSSSFAALHASWSTQSFTDFNGKLRFAERNAIGPILHLFMLAYPVDQEWRSERSFSAARALVHLLDERNLSVTDSWAHEALIQGAVEVASAAGLPGGAT